MTEGTIPCLILGYSRIQSLISLIIVAQSSGFDPIYVSVDGPNTPEVSEIQVELKREIENLSLNSHSKIVLKLNAINLGVAAGIISGIDWFFGIENYGAILEDDLEINDDFYRFVEYGKGFLQSNPKCLMISGCKFSKTTNTMSLTSYPLIWGWATNRQNWNQMREGLLTPPKKLISFNSVENYWMVGSRRVHEGFVDTWDIPLVYFMRRNDLSCLLPPTNLTTNIGFDAHAAHTKNRVFPMGIANFHLPITSLSSIELETDRAKEDRFLEKYVYQIQKKHKLLSIFYWSTKFLKVPTYSPLRSRVGRI